MLLRDKNLSTMSILVYSKIYSLSKKEGFCWATNKYLADFFITSSRTIGRSIKQLSDNNYIRLEFYKENKINIKRKIYVLRVAENKYSA